MHFLIQFLVAGIATLGFAVIFSVPRKELLFCGFTGALGWIVYYVLMAFNFHFVISCLTAAFVLTVFSRIFAVTRRTPVTVYMLTGIFPLVPGAGIYYTAYYLFMGNNAMSAAKGLETFETAAAIVFGIIFGYALPQTVFKKLA